MIEAALHVTDARWGSTTAECCAAKPGPLHWPFLAGVPAFAVLAVGQPVQGLPAGVYRALDRVLDVYPPWPIPRIGAARLGRLGFDDRPGKENLAGLAHLRDLAIWLWRDTDFRFLRSAQELVTLHVEGTKQVGSLERLQACEALVDLEIIDMCPASLEPLGHLTQLDAVTRLARVQRIGRPSAERVWLIGK